MNALLTLLLVTVVAALPGTQQQPAPGSHEPQDDQRRVATAILSRLNAREPGWRWMQAVKSVLPAIGSEERVLVGMFTRSAAPTKPLVFVEVHRVATRSAATRFVQRLSSVPAGRRAHDTGDESWVSEHSSGQCTIVFRVGTFAGFLNGKGVADTALIGRVLVDYLRRLNERLHPAAAVQDPSSSKE